MERLLSLLSGVVKEGNTYKALCPAHADMRPSLTITEGDNGSPLIHCQAGCKTEKVLEALGLTWVDLLAPQTGIPEIKPVAIETDNGICLHEVYDSLLDRLVLSVQDKENLFKRGLGLAEIDQKRYRSLSGTGVILADVVASMAKQWDGALAKVPGFYLGSSGWCLTQYEGLLIPVRDISGHIVGMQIRTSDPNNKYKWLSSADAPSGRPCHVAGWCTFKAIDQLFVTEGPLKADLVMALLGKPCLGVPGVGAWESCIPLIKKLAPQTVVLAFDSDWRTKSQVLDKLQDLAKAVEALGVKVHVADWNPEDGKGIDDVLKNGTISIKSIDSKKEGDPNIWDDGCQVVCLSSVVSKPIDWVWRNWFIRAGVNLIDGDPGLGKSTLVVEIISAMTTGRGLPGDSQGKPLGVLILNGEDDISSTLRPRLDAAGADCDRVFSYTGRIDRKTGMEMPPSLPEDLQQIEALIHRYEIGTLVVDPLFGYVSTKLDMHRDQHVKYLLSQIARMAIRTNVGVFGIRHLTKGGQGGPGIYRGQGSIGIIGAARTCAAVIQDPDCPNGRILLPLKNNLSAPPLPLRFSILSLTSPNGICASAIKWGEPIAETSDSILKRLCQSTNGKTEDRNLGIEAQFVVATLARGPVLASDMYSKLDEVLHYGEAKAKGLANRLQLRIFKDQGRWWWSLPVDWAELGIKQGRD